jgi:myo-inositol-1(or 4)-monophosphatase
LPDADARMLDADLALLVEAAESAADLALSYFRQDPKVWHKENASPVSEADYAVDRLLKETLLAARPDYGWLSEETEDDPARLNCRRVFVVDPIDGTRGFLAGSDEWTISLAVVEDGRPLAAVLIQPTAARLYTATADGGAHVGGHPLAILRVPPIETARVAGPTALMTRLRNSVPDVRDGGYIASLALRIAMIADERLDLAFARPNAHDWDIAAAHLIVTEAGGTLLAANGEDIRYNQAVTTHPGLVAGSETLARQALDRLGLF